MIEGSGVAVMARSHRCAGYLARLRRARCRHLCATCVLHCGYRWPLHPCAASAQLAHPPICQRGAVIALNKTTVSRPLGIAFFETIHILPPSISLEPSCRIRRTRKSERWRACAGCAGNATRWSGRCRRAQTALRSCSRSPRFGGP
ncbi:putative uncharacterized protein [Xanthomonas citri pv. punicae str. LMG 859]|nr:putative uncharacterized protein [Xanthomonas citri pv. punicae str. LMG 859]